VFNQLYAYRDKKVVNGVFVRFHYLILPKKLLDDMSANVGNWQWAQELG
jgi:hypothetical protein